MARIQHVSNYCLVVGVRCGSVMPTAGIMFATGSSSHSHRMLHAQAEALGIGNALAVAAGGQRIPVTRPRELSCRAMPCRPRVCRRIWYVRVAVPPLTPVTRSSFHWLLSMDKMEETQPSPPFRPGLPPEQLPTGPHVPTAARE